MAKFLVPAIILVIVLLLAGVVFTQSYFDSDPPTSASNDSKLVAVTLPTDLPPMVADTGSGDSTRLYNKAIDLYTAKADFLKTDPPPQRLIDDLTETILDAGKRGAPDHGWADDHVGLQPGKQPDWYSAPMEIAEIIFDHEIRSKVTAGKYSGSKARARKLIDAVFLFGKRMYETSDRVLIRRDGLDVMSKAMGMREMALNDKDAGPWREAIYQVRAKWEAKLKAIYTLDASVADLIRFATLDKDPSFQIEAILQLGIAQWTKKSMGNQRVIDNAFADLQKSKNSMVAQAAKAAAAMEKRGDVHKAH